MYVRNMHVWYVYIRMGEIVHRGHVIVIIGTYVFLPLRSCMGAVIQT
jgi:hypothetical protein